MWTKFGLELQKNFEMRTSGGGGVVSDFGHPRTRGEGGQKKAKFCGRPLWMAPYNLKFGFSADQLDRLYQAYLEVYSVQ